MPTRRAIGNDAGTVQAGGALGGEEWVVARADCQYRRVDLSALPVRQRVAAARLAVARHLPAADALAHTAWKNGIAHLWIWMEADAPFVKGERRWIPETLLAAPPLIDGPRLLRLSRGVEGQVWEHGQLEASQWWPAVPDRDGWQRFLRGAGLDAEEGRMIPEPVAFAWTPAPWGERSGPAWAGTGGDLESLAWKTAAVVFALALGWQATGLVRWEMASRDLAQALDSTRAKVAPLLDARERAERRVAEIDSMLGLQRPVSDYALMHDVVGALPEGTLLDGWRREPGKLYVQVRSSEPDPRTFVSAFAGHAQLADLTASPASNGRMQLEFTLPDTGMKGSG